MLVGIIVVLAVAFGSCNVNAILVGTPCASHKFCNFDGPEAIPQTKCDPSTATCQCTILYYGDANDTKCVQAQLGDSCSTKEDPDRFCQTAAPHAICDNGSATCQCENEYYAATVYGYRVCKAVEIGSPCNASDPRSANICGLAVINSECNSVIGSCQCPTDMIFVVATKECLRHSSSPNCSTCYRTSGHCFDREDDGTPSGCTCPLNRASTGSTDEDTLRIGCDFAYAQLGERCLPDMPDGDNRIPCNAKHAECRHAGYLNNKYKCSCRPGYYPVPSCKDDSVPAVCRLSISATTDPNCRWCTNRGGVCYDVDEDGIRDGCHCPNSRSTSDETDPRNDCDVDHVSVECETTTMSVCYMPHNTRMLPDVATKLETGEVLLYVKNYHGINPCMFKMTNSSGRSDWCLELDLRVSGMGFCGTEMGYPTSNVISYSNTMVIQTSAAARTNNDLAVNVFCQYDTLVHAFTAMGTEVQLQQVAASEGVSVHPLLTIKVYDQFDRDATFLGARIGDPIYLEVTMVDDKAVYDSFRPEVCIASSRPELSHPNADTIFLVYDGCPVHNSYLSVADNFMAGPNGGKMMRTGLFSMFKFEESNFVFFHCAVKVCRRAAECTPFNCYSSRKRREIIDNHGRTSQESRDARDQQRDDDVLASLQSRAVPILGADETEENDPGKPIRPGGGLFSPRLMVIIAICGGIVSLMFLLLVVLACKVRLHRSRKDLPHQTSLRPIAKDAFFKQAIEETQA